MKDGAHTHHGHGGPSGLGLAMSIAGGLVLADVIRAILPALLIGLAVVAGLVMLGLIGRVHTAWSHQGQVMLADRDGYPRLQPGDDQAEVITRLQADLAAARTSLPAQHQHLHFHGLDPGQVAAILAAQHDQAASRDGDA